MSVEEDRDLREDEYDEDADSDFVADGAHEEDLSSSSDDNEPVNQVLSPNRKRQKPGQVTKDESVLELDSGDEVTIKEQKRAKRKLKKKGEVLEGDSDDDGPGWRAKTRAMRERDKDEKKFNRLVNLKESTIDVDKLWEEMNKSGPLPPVRLEGSEIVPKSPLKSAGAGADSEQNKENIPAIVDEEMITIKRKFKFAGEVHVEEKIVPKTSAEARLWLSQQQTKSQPVEEGGIVAHRPLRKVSRFDPNYNNLDAFKMSWSRISGNGEPFKGPKLNVVEKSKMDWASHVDAEGLKDELDEHSKAKEGYHGRMDFLNQVEQRKEEEARLARTKR